jgi:hypothetical protein
LFFPCFFSTPDPLPDCDDKWLEVQKPRPQKLTVMKHTEFSELAGHLWLMPVIPEIRGITVQSQPGQTVPETLSRKIPITKIELVQ